MNKRGSDYGWLSRLARPPPATSRWLARMGGKNKRGARLRLDKRDVPPTFTIASPTSGEGEAMAKAGGKETEFGFHDR
jgi:hypothetical protein